MYVIHWKSQVNGRAGTGTKLFDRNEAESLVAELNREYPQIHHEIWEAARAQSDEPSSRASDPSPGSMELLGAR